MSGMKAPAAQFAAILFPILLSSIAPAAVITFQEGASPTTSYNHTVIDIRSTGTTNNGHLTVGRQHGSTSVGNMRGILTFDLSAIPAGSTINSVSLKLTVVSGEGSASTVGTINLHQLTPGGSASNSLVEAQANWNVWATDSPWNTLGGDFGSSLANISISDYPPGSTHTFSSASLASATQSVFSAGSLLQLILISPTAESGTATNFIRFAADDNATTTFRPELTINYTIPEVSSAALGLLGSLIFLTRRSRR